MAQGGAAQLLTHSLITDPPTQPVLLLLFPNADKVTTVVQQLTARDLALITQTAEMGWVRPNVCSMAFICSAVALALTFVTPPSLVPALLTLGVL